MEKLLLDCWEISDAHSAVERILSTYAMMRNLSEKDIEGLRADVIAFLSKRQDLDETRMAVEGIRYLRERPQRGCLPQAAR